MPETTHSDSAPGNHQNACAANALWQAFVEANRISGWKPRDDGSCAMRLNDTRVVVWCGDEEPALKVRMHIAPMPNDAEHRATYSQALLVHALALIDGDVVGVDPVENAAVYQRLLYLQGLDAKGLADELSDMLAAVDELHRRLPAAAPAALPAHPHA